jgi:hypothetical protein
MGHANSLAPYFKNRAGTHRNSKVKVIAGAKSDMQNTISALGDVVESVDSARFNKPKPDTN